MRESGIYQMYLKNLLDRLLALVGTAALSWLLILLGIAIHLDSRDRFSSGRSGQERTARIFTYINSARCVSIPHMICRPIC